MAKPKVASDWLAGCAGCHMSILDIDDRILELVKIIDFDKSPIDDLKTFSRHCLVGLIEGGCSTEENVHVLHEFRENCDILIALGACACTGGIPAMRNHVPLEECLHEAYLNGPTVYNPDRVIPGDREIPLCLDRIYPVNDVVKIDYFLPGCPPSADTIWEGLVALLNGKPLSLPYEMIKYD